MKTYRNLLLGMIALGVSGLFSSCSDTATGAGDATIGFAQDKYQYKETAGLVRIPVKFTGEPKSYPITFSVVAESQDPAVKVEELIHFTQTEGLKYIGNEKNPTYVEFQIFDNDVINDSRFINISISSAEGAEIALKTTEIEIADNDNNPYERLWGDWTFEANQLDIKEGTKTPVSFDVNISGGFTPDEQAANAEKVLAFWGFADYQEEVPATPAKQPVWYVDYSAADKSLNIQVGTLMANIFDFSLGGNQEVKSGSLDLSAEDGQIGTTQKIPGTWSDDCNTITFDKKYAFVGCVYNDGEYMGYWYAYSDIVMKRKK